MGLLPTNQEGPQLIKTGRITATRVVRHYYWKVKSRPPVIIFVLCMSIYSELAVSVPREKGVSGRWLQMASHTPVFWENQKASCPV